MTADEIIKLITAAMPLITMLAAAIAAAIAAGNQPKAQVLTAAHDAILLGIANMIASK